MKRLLLLNGPNLNLLGQREPETYGSQTLEDIVQLVTDTAEEANYELTSYQSNHEGELIDQLQNAEGNVSGIIFNPAAYTHTSVAIRDAVSAISVPVIEVHISNVHNREEFRRHSLIAPAAAGQVIGFGIDGYRLAVLGVIKKIESEGR